MLIESKLPESRTVDASSDWNVVSISTRTDLQKVLADWRQFQNSDPIGASFYNDPDRIDQWLEEFPEAALKTQLVFQGSRLMAVAPLIADSGSFRLNCGPLRSPTIRYSGAVRLGDEFVYARDANVRECLSWVFRGLSADRQLQGIYLRNVDMESDEGKYLASPASRGFGFRSISPRVAVEPSHSIKVLPTFAGYEAQLSKKRRYLFRRMWRLLNENYPNVRIDRITTANQVPAFLDQMDAVYQRTWQGKENARGSVRRNLTRQVSRFQWIADRGWLRSYVLSSDSTPLAYLIGYQYRGQHEIQETGYDPAHRDSSPGSVLWWYSIKDLHEVDSPTRIRFGWGDFPYKRTLSTDSYPAGEIYLVRRWKLACLLHAQRWVNWTAQNCVKPILRRTSVARWRRRQTGDDA
jgi:CelD/BcsL family acetyltransferase involved in cellulose biosynthesis